VLTLASHTTLHKVPPGCSPGTTPKASPSSSTVSFNMPVAAEVALGVIGFVFGTRLDGSQSLGRGTTASNKR
jgi:hypothetical protein